MELVSKRIAPSIACVVLVAATIAACGTTVVYQDEGDGDGGGGGGRDVGPVATSVSVPASSGVTGFTTSSVTTSGVTSSSSSPTSSVDVVSVGPGPGPSSSSGGPDCSEQFFNDPGVDACARELCCVEMARCQSDPESCFDDRGQVDIDLPNGRAFFDCYTLGGCLPPVICDTGLQFGDSEPETVRLARCLSELCCEEFRACVDFEGDVVACIDCLKGEGDPDVCRAALECGAQCGFGVDT